MLLAVERNREWRLCAVLERSDFPFRLDAVRLPWRQQVLGGPEPETLVPLVRGDSLLLDIGDASGRTLLTVALAERETGAISTLFDDFDGDGDLELLAATSGVANGVVATLSPRANDLRHRTCRSRLSDCSRSR